MMVPLKQYVTKAWGWLTALQEAGMDKKCQHRPDNKCMASTSQKIRCWTPAACLYLANKALLYSLWSQGSSSRPIRTQIWHDGLWCGSFRKWTGEKPKKQSHQESKVNNFSLSLPPAHPNLSPLLLPSLWSCAMTFSPFSYSLSLRERQIER